MNSLPEKEIHSLLRLLSVPGFGSYRIRRLITHFRSPSSVFDSTIGSLSRIEGIDKTLARNILDNNDSRFADHQINRCQKENIQIKSISVRKPTLDDVFLHYTGRTIENQEESSKLERRGD